MCTVGVKNAVEVWRGSKMGGKQRILRAVSLNRTVSDVSLCLEKRKPFSFLTERLPVRTSRGDWRNLEREIQPYAAVFLHGPQPHILRIRSIMAKVA
jgi:hypothetical protein